MFDRNTSNDSDNLTEPEALAIGRKAASPELAPLMTLANHYRQDGRKFWTISSATIGYGINVLIDDATGEVLEVKHFGVR